MKMCRQLVGAITATRSHGEEGRELRPDSVDGLHLLNIIVPASSHGTMHPFQASKHGEQASSICGELLRLGALQSFNGLALAKIFDKVATISPFIKANRNVTGADLLGKPAAASDRGAA